MTAARRAPSASTAARKTVRRRTSPGRCATGLPGQGYTVRSEVKDCDIAALRGDELLIVEIKKTLNLALVVQAVQRQRMTDTVYVAVPRPPNKWKWWRESRGVFHLLRRLELGLLLVSPSNGGPPVDVGFHPRPLARRKRAPSRRAVLAEISGRIADYNIAGSTRKKLVTAYRESAIHIACCLRFHGRMAPAALARPGHGSQDAIHPPVTTPMDGSKARGARGLRLSERGRRELAGLSAAREAITCAIVKRAGAGRVRPRRTVWARRRPRLIDPVTDSGDYHSSKGDTVAFQRVEGPTRGGSSSTPSAPACGAAWQRTS